MSFSPTSEDAFKINVGVGARGITQGFDPLDYQPRQAQQSMEPGIQQAEQQDPRLLALAQKLSKSPGLNRALAGAASLVSPLAKGVSRGIESTYLPELSGGITQAGYNAIKNIANLPSDLLGAKKVLPDEDLSRYLHTDETGKRIFKGGEFAGDVGALVAPISKLSALNKFGLAGDVATGMGVGAAESENRLTGAALGAIPGIGEAAYKATAPQIAKSILAAKNAAKRVSGNNFNAVFNASKRLGIGKLSSTPDVNLKILKNGATKKDLIPVQRFMENPSLENAHKAQSELGRIGRKLSKKSSLGTSSLAEDEALQHASSARDDIVNAMKNSWEENGAPHLSESYDGAKAYHLDNVIPYEAKSISQFKSALSKAQRQGGKQASRQRVLSKKLVNSLAKDTDFMSTKGLSEHPEIFTRNLIKDLSGAAGKAALFGLAGMGLGGLGLGAYEKYLK